MIMRKIALKILLSIAGAAIIFFLVGSVIHVAMVKSPTYLYVGVSILTLSTFLVCRVRARNLHLRMADVILDVSESDPAVLPPVNNLEHEMNQAIRINWALHRARRAERVARRWSVDNSVRLFGHPKP
jgi:hypothetical protein